MKFNHPRLFVGPMSKEIVDIVIKYSKEKKQPIGLIPSRRQIEWSGGYVNNWSTKEFSSYVRSKDNQILISRDHGGPGQGQQEDDGKESLEKDIENKFDILHIDPWKKSNNLDDGMQQTLMIIQNCIDQNKEICFEVGTEESIFPYTPEDLDKILGYLEKKLKSDFEKIKYAVIQSGVEISGTQNIGNFNESRLEKMIKTAKKYGVFSKEHNGDYLTAQEIKIRAQLGLDSINIAPEFGVTQTKIILGQKSFNLKKALATCKKVNKFDKWIPGHLRKNPPERMIIEVSGHYCFTRDPFKEMLIKSKEKLESSLYQRFDEIHEAWK